MEYRYLKAFLLTAKYQSFSKAAQSLGIAQSAVSRQIKLLEQSVDKELIIRSSKKIILTHAGKDLYKMSERFNYEVNGLFEKEDEHPIRIGILHGLLKNWFIPKLAKFLRKSNRQFTIHIAGPKELQTGIEKGSFDIVFSSQDQQSDLVTSRRLFSEKMVLISKEEVKRSLMHQHRWVVYSEEDLIFEVSKKRSKEILQVGDIQCVVELVRAGSGVAIVPDHVLRKNESLFVKEINSLSKSDIYMTTLSHKTMPTFLAEVLSFIS